MSVDDQIFTPTSPLTEKEKNVTRVRDSYLPNKLCHMTINTSFDGRRRHGFTIGEKACVAISVVVAELVVVP